MRKFSGWTLVELMIVLSISSILLALSVPSFSGLVARTESTTAVNTMVGLLHYARSTALNQGTLITLCPTADFIHCDNDWNLDLMVFSDPDKSRSVSDDEIIFRIQQPNNSAQWSMRPANKSFFQFDPDGTAHGTAGSLLYCHKDLSPTLARRLFINLGGRPRLSTDQNGDGIHEDNDGSALSCTTEPS